MQKKKKNYFRLICFRISKYSYVKESEVTKTKKNITYYISENKLITSDRFVPLLNSREMREQMWTVLS